METELILEGLRRNKPKDIPDDKTGLCVRIEGQSLVVISAVCKQVNIPGVGGGIDDHLLVEGSGHGAY